MCSSVTAREDVSTQINKQREEDEGKSEGETLGADNEDSPVNNETLLDTNLQRGIQTHSVNQHG